MGLKQTDLINEAERYLTSLAAHVAAQVAIRHQDVLVGMEQFFCELLNMVFGWSLKNDNLTVGPQQDSFDLSDRVARIAVQVTNTTSADKIRGTLQSFIRIHDSKFDQLLFVYPVMRAPASSAKFDRDRGLFDFDSKRDRYDFQHILLSARSLPLDQLEQVVRFLRKSASTILGKTTESTSGRDSGLFVTPRSVRGSVCKTLFGRDEVVAELVAADGDRLVVGQPGVGKTSVLSTLVNKTRGYFLRSFNEESALTSQLRAENPGVIAVEDAHLYLDRIQALQAIRHEHSLKFRIVADCWPTHRDALVVLMELPVASVIELRPISNPLIIAMAKEVGIGGPDLFFHHLVRQSMGYPGRAAMLLRCCREGNQEDIREFFSGDSIARWTRRLVEQSTGPEAMDVLSCLALGRDTGIELSRIANYLDLPLSKVQRIVGEFALGGLVEENELGFLIVFPEAIRPALTRDFFFGDVRRDLQPFASDWRLAGVIAMAAVDAYCVGARIPVSELFRMTRVADSAKVWDRLAAAEDTIADQVLNEKPELFDALVHVFIRRSPERTICRLIETKPEVRGRFNRQPDRYVQTVEDWVKRGYPNKTAIPRRRIVLDAIANQLSEEVPAEQAFRFLGCVFAPEYKSVDQSPENFDTFILRSGLLAPEDLQQMRELWKEAHELLKRYTPIDWSLAVDAMRHWLWPAVSGTVNDEQREQLRLAASETLDPLCELFANSPAAVSELHRLAEYHRIELSRTVPAEYATLFPKESVRDRTIEAHKKFEKQCYQRAVKLGNRWASTSASDVLSQLTSFNEDANRTGHAYPNYSDVVCRTISQKLERQSTWISEAIRLEVPCLLLQPFLQTACTRQESGYEEILDGCLKDAKYRPAAISLLLYIDPMPGDLVKAAISASSPYAEMIYAAALRDEIAPQHYSPLLSHTDSKLRAKVAEGLWGQNKTVPTDPLVREKWRNAIAQDCRREHCVAEIFSADKEVCEQWIRYWSKGVSPIERVDFDEETVSAACAELSTEARKAHLADLHCDSPIRNELIRNLVSDDPDAFRQLLNQESLASYRLSPLRRLPDEAWVRLVKVAISEGISEEKIAKSSGIGWNMDFNTVEDKYRAEILACEKVIEKEKGAISRIARRLRAIRMESLDQLEK